MKKSNQPTGKVVKTKRLVLALGESTNTHIMNCATDIETVTDETQPLHIDFLLKDTGVITHEEHDRILLNPGKYSKVNQIEFNPLNEAFQAAFD